MGSVTSSHRDVLTGFKPLSVLKQLLGPNPSPSDKIAIGKLLAGIIKKKTPYTPDYLDNILLGRQKISQPIFSALYAYWISTSSENPSLKISKPVQVKSLPHRVQNGSLILGSSIHCEFRFCGIPFVPVTHNQKYCCKDHRLEEVKERRRDAKKTR
jgi:hypothetical protein